MVESFYLSAMAGGAGFGSQVHGFAWRVAGCTLYTRVAVDQFEAGRRVVESIDTSDMAIGAGCAFHAHGLAVFVACGAFEMCVKWFENETGR